MDLRITRWYRSCALVLMVGASLNALAKAPHYRFILPGGYIGWVQIVFSDAGAPPLSYHKNALVVVIGESGVVRTKTLRAHFFTSDEFYYRDSDHPGGTRLVSIPSDYVINEDGHGGISIKDNPDGTPGYSWFFFIGPPDIREERRYHWQMIGDTESLTQRRAFIPTLAG